MCLSSFRAKVRVGRKGFTTASLFGRTDPETRVCPRRRLPTRRHKTLLKVTKRFGSGRMKLMTTKTNNHIEKRENDVRVFKKRNLLFQSIVGRLKTFPGRSVNSSVWFRFRLSPRVCLGASGVSGPRQPTLPTKTFPPWSANLWQ